MATAREIRRRIRSVRNIAKVTGALEAVSASKVRRAQNQALASRAYSAAAYEMLADLARFQDDSLRHPLLDERDEINNVLVIAISSDRGLAGPYNTNLVRRVVDFVDDYDATVRFITIGRKGRDLLLRRGETIIAEYTDMPAMPSVFDIAPVLRTAVDEFLTGAADRVYIAYTDFVNTLNQRPTVQQLLPLAPEQRHIDESRERAGRSGPHPVFGFEPNASLILEEILPRFTEVLLFQGLLESLASEHSARMVAMRNATENANALVEDLTLSYNKARQLAITSEILDIVGGAEALAQSEA